MADAMAWKEHLDRVVLAATLPLGLWFLTVENVLSLAPLLWPHFNAFHGGSSFAQGIGCHTCVSCCNDLPPEQALRLLGWYW